MPVLLAALWLVLGVSHLWRRRVTDEAWDDILAVATAVGGQVRPRFSGWKVVAGGVRVDWHGGLSGLVTHVRVGRARRSDPGLLDAAAVRAAIDALRAGLRS